MKTTVTLTCADGKSFLAEGDTNSINLLIKWIDNYIRTHAKGKNSHNEDKQTPNEFYLDDPRMSTGAIVKARQLGLLPIKAEIPDNI